MKIKAFFKRLIVTVLVCVVIHFIAPVVRDASYQNFTDNCVPPVWENTVWQSKVRTL